MAEEAVDNYKCVIRLHLVTCISVVCIREQVNILYSISGEVKNKPG